MFDNIVDLTVLRHFRKINIRTVGKNHHWWTSSKIWMVRSTREELVASPWPATREKNLMTTQFERAPQTT